MGRVSIYPTNGNPQIAALVMAFDLYRPDSTLNVWGTQISMVSFSFDSEEILNSFINEINGIGRGRGYIDKNSAISKNPIGFVKPAYNGGENTAAIINIAFGKYGRNLISIPEIQLIFFNPEEEGKVFFKSLGKYLNDYFGYEAFTIGGN
jgi:hypothetical protein